MKTRLLGGIAALLVAIIGTVLLVSYVQNADKRALAGTETETIYVVQKAIPAGASAEEIASSVVQKSVPKVALAEHNVTNLTTLGSKVASVALVPGEQLLSTRLIEEKSYPRSLKDPGSCRAPGAHAQIADRTRRRRQGDRRRHGGCLPVAGTSHRIGAEGEAGAKSSKTQLSFHKVLVTAAQFSNGSAAQTGNAGTASGTSQVSSTSGTAKAQTDDTYLITIARNSADSERIVFAAEFGKVYLSKEPGDAVEEGASYVDSSRLFR